MGVLHQRVCEALGAIAKAGPSGSPPAAKRLRLLSSLAEGAERLVATAGLEMEQPFELEVVLPFRHDGYEEGSAEAATPGASRDPEFYRLAERASTILALDGDGGGGDASRETGYEAAGRFTVRNADLLLALWDGKQRDGRGGTAEVVQFAIARGVPVWWIPTNGDGPRLLTTRAHFLRPWAVPPGGAATLTEAVHVALRRPPVRASRPHGVLGRLGAWIDHFAPSHRMGAEALISERPAPRVWWGAYAVFERIARWGPVTAKSSDAAGPADDPVWRHWQQPYAHHDGLSNSFMAAYRSSYVLVLLLTALAVTWAVLAIAIKGAKLGFSLLELGTLLLIVGVVVESERGHWHRRALYHRLAAELARKQQFLALLGERLEVARGGRGARRRCAPRRLGVRQDAALRAAPERRHGRGPAGKDPCPGPRRPYRFPGSVPRKPTEKIHADQPEPAPARRGAFRPHARAARPEDRAAGGGAQLRLGHDPRGPLGGAPRGLRLSFGVRSYAEFDLMAENFGGDGRGDGEGQGRVAGRRPARAFGLAGIGRVLRSVAQ